MKILFAVSNENVSNRIVDSYKKRYNETVSSKNVFYFNAILRELQRDKTYDSIVISEDLEPFANSNYDVIDKFIVERLQEVSQEISRIGKDIAIIIICTDRRTKQGYVLNKLYEFGIYNALVGSDRRIDNVCNLINTPRTQEEAKEYYNIQEDNLGNSLDDVSEQEVQNILIHYKKLGKNEDRYTDSFNNIASQYNDKQLRIIIKCLPINVRAVLESECPKYQELVTTQDETEEEKKQKEQIQEQRRIEKEENDKKLQAKIEKERREAEKRALKEQKAAEKAAAKAGNAVQDQLGEAPQEFPETIPGTVEPSESTPSPVGQEAAPASIPSYSTPKTNTTSGSTGIDLLDRKKKEPRMTGNVIIPGNMDVKNERKLYSDEELENLASNPREPADINAQMEQTGNASPISMPEEPVVETSLPGMEEVAEAEPTVEASLPGMEEVTEAEPTVEATLPGMEEVAPVEPVVEATLPGMEEVAPVEPVVETSLPGMEEVAEAEPTVEATLPGMEEAAPVEPVVEATLPGMEDVAPVEPVVEATLPGMEEVAPVEPVVEATLPGMEEAAPVEPVVEATLPGMEEAAPVEPVVEATLPGMEEATPVEPVVEATLPGMEEATPVEPVVEATLPGMEEVAPVEPVVEATLPGMEEVAPVEPVVEATLPGMEEATPVEQVVEATSTIENEIDNNILPDIDEPTEDVAETQTALDGFEEVQNDEEEPKKRGRGRPRKYPVEPPKPKGKRGRPRKTPLPEENVLETEPTESIDLPGFEQVTETVPSVQLPETAAAVTAASEPLYVQTPTGPIAVEKDNEPVEDNDMTGFEDVAVSSTYVEKVTADNIEVPEEEIVENPTVEVPEQIVQPEEPIQPMQPEAPMQSVQPEVPMQQEEPAQPVAPVQPAIGESQAQEAVASVVPVNDLFEEVQTVQLSSSNSVNKPEEVNQPEPKAENPFEQTIEQTPLSQMNPVNQVAESAERPEFVQPVQQANDLDSQVNDMRQNMGYDSSIDAQPLESNSYQTEQVEPVEPVQNYEPIDNLSSIDNQFENIDLGNIPNESSIDTQFDNLDAEPIISQTTETVLPGMEEMGTPEPVEPIQSNADMFNTLDSSIQTGTDYDELGQDGEENYEDLYASTVSSKRLQEDTDNPQNNVTINQQTEQIMESQVNEFEPQPSQNFGVGPQIDSTPQQVEAYVPNDNRMQSIQALEENRAYTTGTLSQVLTKDKKIVAFVGASKSGTSFLINNLATLFSSLGIRTAILDMTKNKNSYFIYTNNDENLRNIAYNCIENLENGIAEGIKVDRNLDVYTAVPNDGKDYSNAEPILSTLIQNESLVLVDCDFTTPWGYFANASEIYLVQSMDILTIQPLTAFLRELKTRGLLEQDKLRVVVNKELKVKGLSSKVIIGGMSFYNDPAMSFMTELFNKDRIKACTMPFDENVYSKYLEQLVNCQISIGGYPKAFMNNLKILGNMVYPLLSKQTYSNNGGGQNYGGGYSNNFSPEMNNTLNQMRNKY